MNKLKDLSNYFALFVASSYLIGFLSWNIYLSNYNFFEQNVLQARYLSAGILALALILVPVFLIYPIFKKIFDEFISWHHFIQRLILIIFVILYFLSFTFLIFPKVPQALGGAKPIPKAIIANADTLQLLEDFGAELGDNREGRPVVQTRAICELYTNNEISLLGITKTQIGSTTANKFIDRFIIVNNDLLSGYDYASAENCPPISMLPYFPSI